jgi:GxxExxY protein
MHQKVSKKYIDWLTYQIIGSAIEVHKALGAGLLERVYEQALCHELELRGFKYNRQCSVDVDYKGYQLSLELRYDVLVEQLIVVEAKSVLQMVPVFESQLLTVMVPKLW